MAELEKVNGRLENVDGSAQIEDVYQQVRGYVVHAQRQVYKAVNAAMVEAYWQIGKTVHEACGENDHAAYSKQVLKYLLERLTAEFGKGFDESNLCEMKLFYSIFSIRDTLCPELSW